MGRMKLKIQRLESLNAQEISVLCDIDIVLLMFSLIGNPCIFRGQSSSKSESQNGMHFPTTTITNDLDCQKQTWLPSGANQHIDGSFSSCPGFSGVVKNQDIDKSRLEKSQRQDEGISIDDFTLRLPLIEQYPYNSYENLREPNFQTRAMDFPINGNFELPRSVYNGLVPAAGSCAISIFDDNVIPQPPNQFNAQVEESFIQHLISNHRHSKYSDDRFSNDA
ncbi:hypothetical protein CDL12_20801 [Handroanthus impetiginosus]|uniref:MADS-box domain-containing protein n=1 Tax=Handroanthus impetiginosus TaxID=429701 RepID=A0A2G9GN46_9LAMI|nr:hypothetical protein CDL12_20801 [Handroanthus impetiginosus]